MKRDGPMKILIVDDEKPARDRLRQLIGDFDEHEGVGQAGQAEDHAGQRLQQRHRPWIVVPRRDER